MNIFNEFPYTDFHEMNLDWIINMIKKLSHEYDDFKVINTINFGGEWDISKSYAQWTIVDTPDHNGYISIKPVPYGITLENEVYWRKVANYSELYADVQNRIVELETKIYPFKKVTPQEFGAVGDGISDDTNAINLFFNAVLNGYDGYIPEGTYLCTSPIIINFESGNIRQFKVDGAGCYRAILKSVINTGISFLFTSGSFFDSFHTVISNIGFISDHSGVTLQIGKDDFSDSFGNANLTNIFIGNSNTLSSSDAVATKLNYLFDCVFNNCVHVCGSNGKGTALYLTLCRFCSFIGGSYSNADIGIKIDEKSFCDTLTFIGSDFENLNYGIKASGTSQYIKFITCYFDIWRPDLETYGINAIYSDLTGIGGLYFDNCLFARDGIYGNGGVDTNHIKNVKINGIYSYIEPPIPVSGSSYVNNSGQDQNVTIWVTNADNNSHLDWYNLDDYIFPGNIVYVQCGPGGSKLANLNLPTGCKITLGYTGTCYWAMRPTNIS